MDGREQVDKDKLNKSASLKISTRGAILMNLDSKQSGPGAPLTFKVEIICKIPVGKICLKEKEPWVEGLLV